MPQRSANWSALPKGVLHSLPEAAAAIGITAGALYNLTSRWAAKPLPDCITLIKTKTGRTRYIVRTI